jgi:hypothetical protein
VQRGYFSSTGYLERTSLDGLWRAEVMARVAPFNRLALSGAVSQLTYEEDAFAGAEEDRTSLAARGEAAVRIGQLWVGGGVVARDATVLPGLSIFDPTAQRRVDVQSTGVIGTARGRLFKAVQVDAYGIAWERSGPYRPRYQSRSQIFLQTGLRRRFPTGNFGLLASVVHDYRSAVAFPVADGVLTTPDRTQTLSGLLEIRIVNAVLTYQVRNATNVRNQFVPLFQAPNTTSVYGVRWEFWN